MIEDLKRPTLLSSDASADESIFSRQNDPFKPLQPCLHDAEGKENFYFRNGNVLDLQAGNYSWNQFFMFEFKVKNCRLSRSHDWKECPYAHPGERARRRDPRKYPYSGVECSDFRKGNCKKGDACECAHGVFEFWLHPARYRTDPCKDGPNCKRKICFFAHSPDQLRLVSQRPDYCNGSPKSVSPRLSFTTNSSSINPPSGPTGLDPINEIIGILRRLELNKVQSMQPLRGFPKSSCDVGSPTPPLTRPGFCNLPNHPTRTGPGMTCFDTWEEGGFQLEARMQRMESKRDTRSITLEKLSKEKFLDIDVPTAHDVTDPDFRWVSDLVD